MDDYYEHHRASVHRGVYPLAGRGDRAVRGRARAHRAVRELGRAARRSSPATPPRRSTSSRGRGARRTSAPATASSSPRWSTTRTSCRGSSCASARARRSTGCRSTTTGASTSTRSTRSSPAATSKVVAVAHVSNVVGTINPVADIVRRAHAAGAVVGRRRLAGGAADPGRPARDRRRLLRLDRPQGLRADRHRHPARPPRAARRDAAVHQRRAHDRVGLAREGHALGDAAGEVRGRHVGDRRGHRPRRRGRLPVGHRHGRGARARARPRRPTRSSAWRRSPGVHDPRARSTPTDRGALVSFALDGVHPHDVAEILGAPRRVHPRRPPLRPAADEAPRRRRDERASFAVHNTREDVDALVAGLDRGQEVFAD